MASSLHSRPIQSAARISATCIRVPTLRAHAEAINVELSRPASETEMRDALAKAPGLKIVDDRATNSFPTPLKASGGDDTLVGRIRPDETMPGTDVGGVRRWKAFNLFVCSDQIRKGAALNAVQIAEMLAP